MERLPAISYVAEPGAEGRWRYVSPQIEELLGYSREEWLADPHMWARCGSTRTTALACSRRRNATRR